MMTYPAFRFVSMGLSDLKDLKSGIAPEDKSPKTLLQKAEEAMTPENHLLGITSEKFQGEK